jgi:hypothetical protein
MRRNWKRYLLYGSLVIFVGILVFLLEETIRLKNTGFEKKTLWDWMELLPTPLLTIIGVYIAWSGLTTWKKQIIANAERDLAKRVLLAVYKVRHAIHTVSLYAEIAADVPSESAKKAHKEKIAELIQTRANLDVELLEAEAVWGDQLNYKSRFLFFGSRVALFDDTNKDDEFMEKLNKDIERIEDLLRPILRLK